LLGLGQLLTVQSAKMTANRQSGGDEVVLHPAAVPKTAIITPFGLFEFLRMPFGLKNAGCLFNGSWTRSWWG